MPNTTPILDRLRDGMDVNGCLCLWSRCPIHGESTGLLASAYLELVACREAHDRVVADESNHYDRYWTPAPNPLTVEWLDTTEEKMREALTDVFCDDAAVVMLTLIAEIRRLTQGPPLASSSDGCRTCHRAWTECEC